MTIEPIAINPARYRIVHNHSGVSVGIVTDDNAARLPGPKLDQLGKYLAAGPFHPLYKLARGTLVSDRAHVNIVIYTQVAPGYWALNSGCAEETLAHPDVTHIAAAYSDTTGGPQATPVFGLDDHDNVISMVIGLTNLGRVDIAVNDVQAVITKGLAVMP